jgi:heme O synthase-like polyprenyltransferase
LGGTGVSRFSNITVLVLSYVNFALPYLSLAAFAGFVYAGFLYVTAYGQEDQIEKAKKILKYSVVGLVLVIFSFSIVRLLTDELSSAVSVSGN